jgi:predicted ferric reductase
LIRPALIWGVLAVTLALPLLAATQSPLLQYRQPVYIIGGFAGVVGLGLMLVQPLLAGRFLPLAPTTARWVHRWSGLALVLAVLFHVGGLWITSPPDVIDVLLFRSPTPFGVWGALAMWGVIAAALLALIRKRLGLRVWRRAHITTTGLAVTATALHALLIHGTMETLSKTALCVLVLGVSFMAFRKILARK